MGVLYYIPARRLGDRIPESLDAAGLAAAGLGHCAGAQASFRRCVKGPDGGGGLVVGYGLKPSEVGVFPGRQEWVCCEGGAVWLGWPQGRRPGPAAFLRPGAWDTAHGLVLGDGAWWGFTPSRALPLRAGYDAAGAYCEVPRESDAAHYEASAWLFDWVVSEGTRPMQEVIARLAVCLGYRYRVGLVECLALGLLAEDLLVPATMAALGVRPAEAGADAAGEPDGGAAEPG